MKVEFNFEPKIRVNAEYSEKEFLAYLTALKTLIEKIVKNVA